PRRDSTQWPLDRRTVDPTTEPAAAGLGVVSPLGAEWADVRVRGPCAESVFVAVGTPTPSSAQEWLERPPPLAARAPRDEGGLGGGGGRGEAPGGGPLCAGAA